MIPHFYDPDREFSELVIGLIEHYETEFEQFWQLKREAAPEHLSEDEEEWRWNAVLEKLADAYLAAISTFDPDNVFLKSNSIDSARSIGVLLNDSIFFRQKLELALLKEFQSDLPGMLRRIKEFFECLATTKSARSRQYLTRMSRAYVHGMEPETILMCGAALESAFDQHLSEDEVRDVLARGRRVGMEQKRGKKDSPLTLGSYVQYMRLKPFLIEHHPAAVAVLKARNSVAHWLPDASVSAWAVMKKLTEVLDAMSRNFEEGTD